MRLLASLGLALLSAPAASLGAAPSAARPPNVLFLAVDDLRNDLGVAGAAHAQTPRMDAFAATARYFTRHFVQVPTCGATRATLLSGHYPTTQTHGSNEAIRLTHPDWIGTSLPAWFQRHGYRTLSLGKISHYPGNRTGKDWAEGPEEMPGVWEKSWIPASPWKTAQAMMHGYANGGARRPGGTPPWEAFDGPDTAYPDAWVAGDAVDTLRDLARGDRPWFFAVGFFKPHLPFVAPKRYFDRHDPARIPEPKVTARPAAPSSWHTSNEFRRNYAHNGRDPEQDPAYARLMRHAYAAATTYVDAQIGRVLAALDELGLAGNTVVVLWGDHGFLLGEHAIWGKHCLYEEALRSPFMIRAPGLARPGQGSGAIVETVDIFPTLVDLCGLPAPAGLDGRSLRPQLADPAAAGTKPARAYWTGGQRGLRTERWRLIAHGAPGPDGRIAAELFDLQEDPFESTNVAAAHPDVVAELSARVPLLTGKPIQP